MLRRKPTAITLTTEDIAIYEDARAREAQAREQAAQQAQMQMEAQQTPEQQHHNSKVQFRDPREEMMNSMAGNRRAQPQVRTREERLGIGMGGSSRN